MKKVMIALAAVALAGAAQASTTFNVTGLDAYKGWSVYCLLTDCNGNGVVSQTSPTYADLALADSQNPDKWYKEAFFPDSSGGTWASYYSDLKPIYSEYFALAPVDADGKTSWTSIGSNPQYAYLRIALLKDDITPGGEIVVLSSYSAEDDTTHTVDFSSAERTHTLFTGYLNVDGVPEPTSGLLMLIGMAGLALRRKRA